MGYYNQYGNPNQMNQDNQFGNKFY